MLLDFFNTVAKLKDISRQGWIDKLDIEKPESVADHCYSMAMMGLVLAKNQNFDTLKVLKLVLIHDLAESQIGDLTPSMISKTQKNNLESDAMNNILQTLPDDLERELKNLWFEYLEQKTPESILVHEIDKLEMVLQAKIYEKKGHTNIQSFLDSSEKEIKNSELKEIFRKIINQ